jgi:hypothetical protein
LSKPMPRAPDSRSCARTSSSSVGPQQLEKAGHTRAVSSGAISSASCAHQLR